ncbi:sensor histidine kinase [Arthrobacter sp. H14]|uniref:sensor histidine kinase n=1 Tax=Arthrobacter sp. H14 TaxID=1312959 RepID=UPI00047BBBDC|nr:histidine kinase [Arthrobacter sp. H14]
MSEKVSVGEAAARTDAASLAEFAARRRGPVRRFFVEHPWAMDIAVVLAFLALSLPGAIYTTVEGDDSRGLGIVILAAAVLLFRRHWPLAVLGILALLEPATSLVGTGNTSLAAGLWFGLYAVAVVWPWRFSFIAMFAASLPAIVALWFVPMDVADPGPFLIWINVAILLLTNIIATGIGVTVRRDRYHSKELLARALENAELASVTERTRIAREMHDVVAHSLSVMIALSDGAGVVIKRDQARAVEVLEELSKTGRTALADMRRVLGVLRENGPGDAPLLPLPAEKSLTSLLDGFRIAGLPIRHISSGPSLPEDAAFQLTVYRIVQESLTNVLRYGKNLTMVEVAVSRADEVVRIKVFDDGRGTMDGGPAQSVGAGLGIVGMAERASIYSGTVHAGPGANGGWLVEAELVWAENGRTND